MKDICRNILKEHNTGITNRQIAKNLGIHHNTVKYWLDKQGLTSNANVGIKLEVVDGFAVCSKCGKNKPEDEYIEHRHNRPYPYKSSYCNGCRKKQLYLNMNSDVDKFLSDRYNRLLLRARKKDIPVTITKEEFIELYHSQNGKCFYTDIKMVCRVGDGSNRYSMSIDKIIPELGYTKNNTVLCINKANTIKNDCSLEEIREWMPEWHERIISKIND